MQETSTSPASLPGSPRLENIEDRILPHPKNLSSDVPAAEYAEHLAVEMSALGHSPTVDESASRLRSGDSTDLPVYWRRRQPEFMWTQVSKENPSQLVPKAPRVGKPFLSHICLNSFRVLAVLQEQMCIHYMSVSLRSGYTRLTF